MFLEKNMRKFGRKSEMTLDIIEEKLRELYEEAMVDCYGIEEQRMSLYDYLYHKIECPFQIRHLGMDLAVVELDQKYELLKFVVDYSGTKYTVDITDAEITNNDSNNYLLIEAYKLFLSRNW